MNDDLKTHVLPFLSPHSYRQVLISWTNEYMEKNFHSRRCGEGLRKEEMVEH